MIQLPRSRTVELVTGNHPSDPFNALGGKKRIAPNLEAIHLPLDELDLLVTGTFEMGVDVNSL